MPKKKKKLFAEGVYGLGATPFNENYDAKSDHGTFYGGLLVSENVYMQLKSQPSDSFLSYKKIKDQYEVKYKIPDYGRSEDCNYKLRENINKVTKWAYEQVLNKNGGSNAARSTAMQELDFSYDKLIENGYPEPKNENEKKSFQAFCNANKEIIRDIATSIYGLAKKVNFYESLIENLQDITEEPDKQTAEQLLKNNFQGYLNATKRLHRLADIQPDETECFIPWECGASRRANIAFADQANSFSAFFLKNTENKHQIETAELSVHYEKQAADSLQVNVFDHHYACGLKARINDQDILLSLESTAPRAGEMFFCPESSSQGLGLYRNTEEFEKTFKDPLNSAIEFKTPKERDICTQMAGGYYKGMKNPDKNKLIGHPSFKVEMYKLRQRTTAPLYGDLKRRLSKVDRFVWSSDKFSEMKDALLSLENIKSTDDYVVKMSLLSQKASEYLKYKLPNGDLVKESGLSDLAKKRIEFAKDVFTFSNLKLTEAAKMMEQEVSKAKQRQPGMKDPEAAAEKPAEKDRRNPALLE